MSAPDVEPYPVGAAQRIPERITIGILRINETRHKNAAA